MFTRILHFLITGCKWELKGQTVCVPNLSVANRHANIYNSTYGFTEKQQYQAKIAMHVATWGWSECLLTCTCGRIKIIQIVGEQKR